MSVKEIFDSMDYGPAPEAANLALEWLQENGGRFGAFIGGQWLPVESTFDTYCPANGKPIAKIAQCAEIEINAAVDAATNALGPWQEIGCEGRAKFLYALARQVQKHARLLSVIESLDNGKPIRETRDLDIPLVSRHFYHHAGWAMLRDQEFPAYEPVGVCGQIIPWNFPLLMLSWKIAPALAMGNTVVLKPAEFTSLSALLFAQICAEIGLPAGVVNIVTGDGATGKLIVEHENIDKIAFTGSTEVGRILRKATAGSGKKLSLELGGKSPYIVFEDADLDSAVEGLVDAIWFNQGQVCCAGSRLLVQEGIAEKVFEKIRTRMASLRIGDPLDKAIDVGAIVDKVQLDRIDSLVKQGVQEGAEIFQTQCNCNQDGWFYPPTLLTNVSPASTVAQIEIFGPVLVAMTFRTPAEAIDLANNTVYGLAASIWTENLNIAHDMASKVKAGTVWINCTNQFDGASGFGGYRESGYGREGGREGLFEYLKPSDFWLSGIVTSASVSESSDRAADALDRTHKLYIGGKQARPDGGYSYFADGQEFSRGNRKDIRNAVEAAQAAWSGWASQTASLRAQVLYYLAENLSADRTIFESALMKGGATPADAADEVDRSIARIMHYAAWTDKYDGAVHAVPLKSLTYTRNESIGVAGVVCPEEAPLLALISLALPLIAMGNPVVQIPSASHPLPACELYRLIEASDIPAGVWNIITGPHDEIETTLADHDTVQVLWHFGSKEAGARAELGSLGNLKQTWCALGKPINWRNTPTTEWLRKATQVKNIWTPYGS